MDYRAGHRSPDHRPANSEQNWPRWLPPHGAHISPLNEVQAAPRPGVLGIAEDSLPTDSLDIPYRLPMAMSDHVRRLRELIGTELLLLPSVSVLVRDDDGRLMLVRHADSGLWGLIGGAIEVNERPEDTAIRETEEETGLIVEPTHLVTVLGGPRFRVRYPNGDETAYVTVVYEARVLGGVERADGDETIELGWFRLEDLKTIDLGTIAQATFEELGWLSG